ncbi:hypothetical protein AVEN_34773-1 [Araneus ventricosus]|uniref:Uncharacterized protein n=1 Tax=Araneus ventricosus TaxID=182803 RepID=A0A4Y2N0J2_ARAVE|nr:hypothetical protein AVEN_34773-1 [Araneus ventricosus]
MKNDQNYRTSFIIPSPEKGGRSSKSIPPPLISGIMCNTYCSFTQRDEITAHASRTAPLQKKDTFPGDVVSYKQGTNEVERKSPNRGPVIGVVVTQPHTVVMPPGKVRTV